MIATKQPTSREINLSRSCQAPSKSTKPADRISPDCERLSFSEFVADRNNTMRRLVRLNQDAAAPSSTTLAKAGASMTRARAASGTLTALLKTGVFILLLVSGLAASAQ